jgi:hypothetical protein
MLKQVAGASGLGVAGWIGVSSLGGFGSPENPLPTLTRELTIEEVISERDARQSAALDALTGAEEDETSPDFDAREFRRQVEFDYLTLRDMEADAMIFAPSLAEMQADDGSSYFIQDGHPRVYHRASNGQPIESVIVAALAAGSFEYGHFVRDPAGGRDLHPGVLITAEDLPQGFIVHRTLFEGMVSHVADGGTLDPELQPWHDTPLWNARIDSLQMLNELPSMRTQRTLAEHLAGTSRELCAYLNPPPENMIDWSQFAQPGGFTSFVTTSMAPEQLPDRVIEVIDLDVESNIAEVVRHAPSSLDIPTEVRVPVIFSYDAAGHIESVHPDQAFVRDQHILYRCGSQSRDATDRSASLASIERGMFVTGLPVLPATGDLPFRAESGFVIFSASGVDSQMDHLLGHRRVVSWEPIRIDFLRSDGGWFNTGYLASYDLIEDRYYRISVSYDANMEITERILNLENTP